MNRFVAGGIAAIAMSLLAGTAHAQTLRIALHGQAGIDAFTPTAQRIEETLGVEIVGWTARLDGRSVAGAIGQRATLGIRPEDIRPVNDAAQADLSGAIAIVERLGAETYLNVRDGQDTLLVRAQGDLALTPGAAVHLALNHGTFHLFDQSGRVIAA